MAAITQAEVKMVLGITDTSKDTLIDFYIPLVEDDIESYCRQTFDPWPVWMKPYAAYMVGYRLNQSLDTSNGMKSESQGGYSYTKDQTSFGYPAGMLSAFDRVALAGIHYGQKTTKSEDRRGQSLDQLANGRAVDGVEGVPYAD